MRRERRALLVNGAAVSHPHSPEKSSNDLEVRRVFPLPSPSVLPRSIAAAVAAVSPLTDGVSSTLGVEKTRRIQLRIRQCRQRGQTCFQRAVQCPVRASAFRRRLWCLSGCCACRLRCRPESHTGCSGTVACVWREPTHTQRGRRVEKRSWSMRADDHRGRYGGGCAENLDRRRLHRDGQLHRRGRPKLHLRGEIQLPPFPRRSVYRVQVGTDS
jgi:hypothetical protein